MKFSANRVLLVLLAVALALVLGACEFRIHADLVIEEDESGTFSLELSLDEELAALAGGDFENELAIDDEMVPDAWAVEVVSEDGYEGVRATVAFNSLSELVALLDELAADGAAGEGELPVFLTDILPTRVDDRFMFRLSIPDNMDGFLGEDLAESPIPMDLGMLDSVFDIRLTLVLPGEIVSSNADVVTGETLIWNLSLTDGGRILEAESRLPDDGNPFIVWGAVALGVIVALALAIMIFKGRRSAASEADEPDEADEAVVDPAEESEEDEGDGGDLP